MVPLAEGISGVALLLQDFGAAGGLWWHDAIVAGETHGAGGMAAEADRVMIASSQNGRPRW